MAPPVAWSVPIATHEHFVFAFYPSTIFIWAEVYFMMLEMEMCLGAQDGSPAGNAPAAAAFTILRALS